MVWVVLAMFGYALVVWPLVVTLLAFAAGDPPRVVRFGMGPAVGSAEARGVRLELGPLPIGSWVQWPDERVPMALALGSHLGGALLFGGLAAALDPVALGAAARFGAAVATFRSTGVGGLVGGWRAAAEHAAQAPLGSVLAGLAVLAVANVVLALLQAVDGRLGLPITAILPLAWLGWLIWLDLR